MSSKHSDSWKSRLAAGACLTPPPPLPGEDYGFRPRETFVPRARPRRALWLGTAAGAAVCALVAVAVLWAVPVPRSPVPLEEIPYIEELPAAKKAEQEAFAAYWEANGQGEFEPERLRSITVPLSSFRMVLYNNAADAEPVMLEQDGYTLRCAGVSSPSPSGLYVLLYEGAATAEEMNMIGIMYPYLPAYMQAGEPEPGGAADLPADTAALTGRMLSGDGLDDWLEEGALVEPLKGPLTGIPETAVCLEKEENFPPGSLVRIVYGGMVQEAYPPGIYALQITERTGKEDGG